jgi:hypothetical protein
MHGRGNAVLFQVAYLFRCANYGPIIYWAVVAAICALNAYGRFMPKPFLKEVKYA